MGLLVTAAPCTVTALIRATALSHRSVSGLLEQLGPWLDCHADALAAKAEHRAWLETAFGPWPPGGRAFGTEWGDAARTHPLLPELVALLAAAPAADPDLDHVPATPLTCLKRALFLAGQYDLEASGILFLGDHDGTSLALGLLAPTLPIEVVDIDERVLDFACRTAAARGWRLRVSAADLRLELPPTLAGSCSLVFTDPPYTPEGVGLFLARAVEALPPCGHARVLMAYGFGETQTALAYRTQSVLHQLRLVTEAVLPHFSEYDGAPAIGSTSALYVCRPTRRTAAAAAALPAPARVYTHGREALEATPKEVPTTICAAISRCVGSTAPARVEWVGEGWPEGGTSRRPAATVPGYLRALSQPHGKPPFTREPFAGTTVVNLYPLYGASVLSVALASAAQHLVLVAGQAELAALFALAPSPSRRSGAGVSAAARALGPLLDALFQRQPDEPAPADGVAVIVLDRAEPAPPDQALEYLLRYLADRRLAKLGNSWREGLIAAAAQRKQTLTKNQARDLIRGTGFPAEQLRCHLRELPRMLLEWLVDAARQSLAAAEALALLGGTATSEAAALDGAAAGSPDLGAARPKTAADGSPDAQVAAP